jgi:hypothetical protein
VSNATDQLIELLATDLAPVTRLHPPLVRAARWLGAVVLLGATVIVLFADLGVFATRVAQLWLKLELVGSLTTGCLAVIAAFQLALPDRPLRWALLPLPSLALWLAGSGSSCYQQWVLDRGGAWTLGESGHCFLFILGVGLPLGAALLLALGRARPIAPLRVAVMGGLGTASLAAFLLQFFHPFDTTAMDLTMHAAGVAAVTTVLAWRRSWAFGRGSMPR